MEEKLFNRIMEKEMGKEEELNIPDSINIKLGKAYEIIKSDKLDNVNKNKTNKRKNAIIAASLAFLVLTTVVVTPALADNIPPLKELAKHLKNIYSFNDNYITNATEINMSKTYDGIEVALQGVIYDESSLKFIYTITSDKKLQWGVQLRKNSLKVNGKEIPSDTYLNQQSTVDTKISKEDDKLEKYAVITSYDISNLKLDDKVSIDWSINEIHTQNYKFAEGNWEFSFKASKQLLKENSKIFDVNYNTTIDGYKLSIDKVIFTPIETKILASYDPKFYEEYYKIIEPKGNEEEKERIKQIAGKLNFNNVYICDENGNTLECIGGRGYNGKEIMLFKPMAQIPKKLIITPFSEKLNINRIPKENQYKALNELKAPFEYNDGKDMSFIINSMKRDGNKLKMNVTFKGDFIERRALQPFVIVPKNIKPIQINVNGENFMNTEEFMEASEKTRKVSSWDYYEKANNINNTLDYEFELKDNEDYNIVFEKYEDNFFRKDQQLTIDLNK